MTIRFLKGFEQLESRKMLAADFNLYSDGNLISNEMALDIHNTSNAADTAFYASTGSELKRFLTTAGDPNDYIVSAGGPYGGVVRLNITHNSGNYLASASLLPNGQYLLTASHNFFDPVFGTAALSVTATFDTLPNPIVVSAANIGNYNGDATQTGDIAVATLSQQAPATIPQYDIYRYSNEVGSTFVKAGYGGYGNGDDGEIGPAGTS